MRLDIVYDNSADPGFKSGWGFSARVAGSLLFDTGENGRPLLTNLKRLSASLDEIRAVAISHDHWDHAGGLERFLKKRPGLPVYVCPGFGPRFYRFVETIGGRPVTVSPGMEIVPGVLSTGEVAGTYKGMPMPEQALVLKTDNGISVVTGCSHPGILEMVRAARRIVPDTPLHLVLGGFHLKDHAEKDIRPVAEALREMGVRLVGPTHCTGKRAQEIFREIFGPRCLTVAAGTTFEC